MDFRPAANGTEEKSKILIAQSVNQLKKEKRSGRVANLALPSDMDPPQDNPCSLLDRFVSKIDDFILARGADRLVGNALR